jgi:SSS family solute:Na+ symporter
MKCFTGKSARTVQLSAVLYPSFLLFLVPLVFIGYTAVLEGVASNDRVLLDVLGLPQLGDTRGLFACMAFALLAASMSTGDALLHAGGSIAIRDVLIGGFGARLDTRAQTFAMRICIVVLAAAALVVFIVGGEDMSVVDLLLLAYSVPIQFLPLTLAGLYWRRANRTAAEWALLTGLGVVVALFACNHALPELYASLNPWNLQIGIIGGLCNTLVLIALSALLSPMDREHLRRFDL